MKPLKKYITGMIAALAFTLIITGTAFAHSGHDTPTSGPDYSMMNAAGMMEDYSDNWHCPMWR